MKGIAFKVTYNDGGAEGGLFGFRGVCSDRTMLENVRVRKMTNCSDDKRPCPCYVFSQNNFRGQRPRIPPCYEGSLFKDQQLRFGGGYFHHGEKAGEPIPIRNVDPGDIVFLTTLLPGDRQKERIIFACYRVGKPVYLQEDWGYMVDSDGTMDIRLPDDIARKLNFWRYFQNSDGSY